MSENRNIRLPINQQPGNFGMQQFPTQFVQPGMVRYPMMQSTGHMMHSHGQMPRQPNMMFPGQMGMRGPGIAPPPYRPTGIGQHYRTNNPQIRQPMSPETIKKMEKEKFYQEQKHKLKQFHTQSVDPNKLIESMFGKTEKPKVKEKQSTPAMEEDFSESFGDFIGGPTTTLSEPVQQQKQETVKTGELSSVQTNGNQSPRGNNSQEKSEKKVDINTMMMECSDLTTPTKPKTFHKPSLKEVNLTQHAHTVKQHESNQARQWKQMNLDDLGDMFVVEEPTVEPRETTPEKTDLGLPHWCKDDTKIPELYKHVLEASVRDGVIQTDRLYPILILSGLPKEVLGHIWSMCNKMTPGQLIKEELYLILGFIFLAQNKQPLSIELLHRIPHAPVPFLASPQQPQPPDHRHTASPPKQITTASPPNQSHMAHPSPQFNVTPSNKQEPDIQNQPMINQSLHSSHSPAPVMVPPSTTVTQITPIPSLGSFGQSTVSTTTQNLNHGQATNNSISLTSSATTDSWHSHDIGINSSLGNTVSAMEEDDFADFQAAPKIEKEVKDKSTKPVSSKEDKKEYLYSVPLPDDDLPEHQISTEQHYSNVSNFFGSDDSSGVSTPNSIDDDFDDFKSAGRPSDSSQFTSSEQSENEDFKVLESYLDDFSKKKQESPLHRPISKTTNLPPSVYNKNVNPIPAIKSLWPNQENKSKSIVNPAVLTNVKKTDKMSPLSSDSEFADFQQAPVPKEDNLSVSKSASDLIGDEDKYAALRVFESVDTSGPSLFETSSVPQENTEIEEADWADFQSTETVVPSDQGPSENLFTSAVNGKTADDWSGVSAVKQKVGLHTESTMSGKNNNDWSDFSQTGLKNDEEDWADFQGPSQNTDNSIDYKSDRDESPAPIIAISQSDLVTVKKKNLQHEEILGLFKPRDDPEVLTSYVLTELNQKETENSKLGNKGYLETEIDEPGSRPFQQNFPVHQTEKKPKSSVPKLSTDDDEDLFRVPPPMDDGMDDDDEYGEFSRGYDIEDVSHSHSQQSAQDKKKVFTMYGMEFSSLSGSDKKRDSDSSNQFTLPSSGSQNDLKLNRSLKAEDTNSVSSLELPFSKIVVQNVKDSDSVSISSNEFNSDFPQGKTLPDSKSVDSLDLKISESKSVDSFELKAGETKSVDSSDIEDKSETDEKKEETDSDKVTEENNTKTEFPVIGGLKPQSIPLFGDRYSGIMEDVTGSDKYAYEWQRCLENCYRMIKDANNIFNSISSSAVCNEVIRSEQGTEYVQGIVEVYRIVCRITVALKSSALGNDKLSQILKDIDLVWNNLTAFLVGGNIMPDDNTLSFKHCMLKSDDVVSQMRSCGVCLLDVDIKSKDFNSDEDSVKLTYGGRQYHATCANFWVNCVDSMLPALKLPELL